MQYYTILGSYHQCQLTANLIYYLEKNDFIFEGRSTTFDLHKTEVIYLAGA